MSKIILNFDESGNLGKDGRYFTIACVETDNINPLRNVMKKAELKTKKKFPAFSKAKEIKCSDANPIIKDYYLRKIVSKDINIRYIVADLHHVKKALLDDENVLYNFMLHYIIVPVAKYEDSTEIDMYLDKRTIKVGSINSFEDYIKIKLNGELDMDVKVNVKYVESHNSYPVQAADFLANAIYSYYEYGHSYYYDLFEHKIIQKEHFPWRHFGQDIQNVFQLSSTGTESN